MRNSSAINALAIVAAGAAAVALFVQAYPRPPRHDIALHREIGRALAEQALQLASPSGKFLVLLRDSEAFPHPATDALLSGFQQETRRAGRAEVTLQALQLDPLRPVQVPGGDFVELLRRGAPGDVLVSFMGPPVLTEDKRLQVGTPKAKIVAFCPGPLSERVDLHALHEQGLLHAAVVARQATGPGALGPKPRADHFEDLYERADAAALARRPSPGANP